MATRLEILEGSLAKKEKEMIINDMFPWLLFACMTMFAALYRHYIWCESRYYSEYLMEHDNDYPDLDDYPSRMLEVFQEHVRAYELLYNSDE